MTRIAIIRLEMNGVVIAKMLKSSIEEMKRIKFSKIYFIVASEIVLAMLQNGEIQGNTKLINWCWTDDQSNVAWVTN